MPQDWFPIDANLATKPEVQRCVDRLGDAHHVADVIGPLVIFWGLVDQHAVPINADVIDELDGLLPEYTRRMIARVCGGGDSLWGIIERETGWVKFDESGVLIRGFIRRFGVGSKTRARAALRQQVSRSLSVTAVTKPVTEALPKDRTGKESKSSGPARGQRSFADIAAESVAEIEKTPAPLQSGPGCRKNCWEEWPELLDLLKTPLSVESAIGFEGQVSRALRVPKKADRNSLSVSDVLHAAKWLVWQANQDWPHKQPATEAALVALVAAIVAKRDSAPNQPGAAVIALLMSKPTNAKGEPVDRGAEWEQARGRVVEAKRLVEAALRPSATSPVLAAADPDKQRSVEELRELEERYGSTLAVMGKDALLQLAQSAPETARPMLVRAITSDRLAGMRPTLLRLLAARQPAAS